MAARVSNLLVSTELCYFILSMCNLDETSTLAINASKIMSLSVFECFVTVAMG